MIIVNLFTSHNIDFVIPFVSLTTSEFPSGNSTKSLIKSNSDGGFPVGFNSVEVGRNLK